MSHSLNSQKSSKIAFLSLLLCGLSGWMQAATDYGDYILFPSASGTTSATIFMGTNATDGESANPTTGVGTADNTTGTNDEDGVTVTTLTAGQSATITVKVTNNSTVYLNGWIDYNHNNVLTDSGEQVIVNQTITAGTAVNKIYVITVPVGAYVGTVGARFRLSTTSNATSSTGLVGTGEVEDYAWNIAAAIIYDYGDLAGTGFATTTTRSTATTNLRMGATVDAEASVTPDAAATADGADEDGVVMPSSILQGATVTIPVTVFNNNTACQLRGWIDFNNDGTFNDTALPTGEIIYTGTVPASASLQTVNVTFTVPNTASAGTGRGVRFRVTDNATTTPTGTVGSGEVEDYIVSINANLAAGNLVWADANDNGRFETGEGVAGVVVKVFTAGTPVTGTPTGTATTDAAGLWQVSGLAAGTYFAHIPKEEFLSGGDLIGKTSLPGAGTDNGRDDNLDENGLDNTDHSANGVSTANFVLAVGLEPTTSETGQDTGWDSGSAGRPPDANANLTIDFGFSNCAQSNLMANGGFETANPTTLTFTGKFPDPSTGSVISNNYTTTGNTVVAGWTVDAGSYVNDATHATEGNRMVYLSGGGSAVQHFGVGSTIAGLNTLTSGAAYTLSFDWCAFDHLQPAGNAAQSTRINVEMRYVAADGSGSATSVGNIIGFYSPSAAGSMTNPQPLSAWSNLAWQSARAQILLPTPPSGKPRLQLLISASGTGKALLDNVSIVGTCSNQMCAAGNLVWADTNGNGHQDNGETGIDDVLVEAWRRPGSGGDYLAAQTYTRNGGQYLFTGLEAGNYTVRIHKDNWLATTPSWLSSGAGRLNTMVSSTGNGDPNVSAASANDDNVNEKGVDDAAPGTNGISSPLFALAVNSEPTTGAGASDKENGLFSDLDSAMDASGDLTVDFGFRAATLYDFGDLPDTTAATGAGNYQTLLANNGPRHVMISGLKLGANIDAEPDGTSSSNATGDDNAGTPDDEDGIASFPGFTPGTSSNVSIAVVNTTATAAKLSVWVDFNNNGSFADAGEQVAVDTAVAVNATSITVPVAVPTTVVSNVPLGFRVRLSHDAALTSLGAATDGEVEDYQIMLVPTSDYGDLADGTSGTAAGDYQTLLANNGPRHTVIPGLQMGATISAEWDAAVSASATGDDSDDGVATLPALVAGTPSPTFSVTVTNTTASAAKLSVWIDFNNNGSFADTSEQVASDLNVAINTTSITVPSFAIPATANVTSPVGMRLRLSQTGSLTSLGAAASGEVEDYRIVIAPPVTDFGDYPLFASASQVASPDLRIGTNATDTEGSNPATGLATADNTTATNDEDLTMPTLSVGASTSFTIPVTINAAGVTGGTARLGVFVDWTGDNDVSDAGENLTPQTVNASGNYVFQLAPPIGTTPGTKYLRLRITEGSTAPLFSGSSALEGEVEDYAITVNPSPCIFPSNLSLASIGTAYSQNSAFSTTGMTLPIAWSAAGLPAGLSLDTATAKIIGTPNGTAVNATVSITAVDATATTFTRTYTLFMDDAAPNLLTNGEFETGTSWVPTRMKFSSPSNNSMDVTGSNTPLTGMTTAMSSNLLPNNSIFWIQPTTGKALTGSKIVHFRGDDNCVQLTDPTLSGASSVLTPGSTYEISIYAANTEPTVSMLDFEMVNGGTILSQLFNLPATTGNWSEASGNCVELPWVRYAWTFTPPANWNPANVTFFLSPQSTGTDVPGAVIDHWRIVRLTTEDYGDFSGFASANSTTSFKLKLGYMADAEAAAITDATATGDDLNVSDDEDGATVPTSITPGASVTIPVIVFNNTGANAYLNAWIDFNGDGVLSDALIGAGGERLEAARTIATASSATTQNITFTVPTTALPGPLRGLRFRLTNQATTLPTGAAGLGEVEDYTTTIASISDFGDYPPFPLASQTPSTVIRMGTAATDTDPINPTTGLATADNTTGTNDEDLTMPTCIIGANTTLTIPVTVTPASLTGGTARLSVFVDWNGDNDVTGAGETLPTQTVNASGNFSFTLSPPAGTTPGTKFLRLRITEGTTAATFGGASQTKGEVEDYAIIAMSPTDFGDLYDATAGTSTGDYQSLLANNGPRHVIVSGLKMGATATAEVDALINATATADSSDDGVASLPSLIAGINSPTFAVSVTNTTASVALLSVWIDFNNNGNFADAGEQVTTDLSVPINATSVTVPSFLVPANAYLGGPVGMRLRLSTSAALTSLGLAPDGEVEDYLLTITPQRDYGDWNGSGAATTTTNSIVNQNLRLGATVDSEITVVPNATATADGADEDGVAIPTSLIQGGSATIPVTVFNNTGVSAYLNAWIDLNNDGTFSNVAVTTAGGERIYSGTVASSASAQTINVTFTVPATASAGANRGVRFRLTDNSSTAPTGVTGTGEVEDYVVGIYPPLSIGNLVWNDANNNGLKDTPEGGIANVQLELWTPGADNQIGGIGANLDVKVATTTTASDGTYSFGGLVPGKYYVKVPTPPLSRVSSVVDAGDNGVDGNNNGDQPAGPGTTVYSPILTLAAGTEPGSTGTGQDDNTIDFGFVANAGSPFTCDNRFYIIQNAETSAGSGVWDTTLYYISPGPVLTPLVAFPGKKLNGLSIYAGYLYCMDQNGNHLYRINSLGTLVDMGAIAGMPTDLATSGQISGAAASADGKFRVNVLTSGATTALNTTTIYTIDLHTATLVGSGVVMKDSTGTLNLGGNFGDICWDPVSGKLYGYNTGIPATIGLTEINLATGACTLLAVGPTMSFGSMAIDANGLAYGYGGTDPINFNPQTTLYVFNRNAAGQLDGSMTPVGTGPSVSNSDGAACPGASPTMKVGNLVWNDVNNNGLKDTGETGLDGVNLQLFLGGQDPLTATALAATTTSGGGLYSFSYLSPGQYFVYIPTPPTGYAASSAITDTADNGQDNDDNGIQTASGAAVRSPLIALVGGAESITDGDTDANTDLTIDFGFRATEDYGDYILFGDASSTMTGSLSMGTLVDAENVATTNGSATGDDTTYLDDEDGVVLPAMTAGAPASIPVIVNNTTGSPAYLSAWIDYNNDGLLTGSGEKIASDVVIATGSVNVTQNLDFTVSPASLTFVNLGVRFRLCSTPSAAATGPAGLGEVEDYLVNISPPTLDYGDWITAGTASSIASTNLRMGALVDTEYTAQRNAAATGDDLNGSDDEDGVTFPTLTAGGTAIIPVQVTNNIGAGAYLNAWIDFNNNGSFADSGEQVASNVPVASGTLNATQNVTISLPSNAVTGTNLGCRFRLTSTASPGPVGYSGTGEVEDYLVTLVPPATDFGDFSRFASASSVANTNLRIGALVDTEFSATTNLTATGDDLTGSDDEDGVTLPSMTAGAPAIIPVVVTNSTGTPAYLSAWIDYNNDGVPTGAGEQIAADVLIPTGSISLTQNLNLTVAANASTGTSLGVRVRLCSVTGASATGAVGTGEVEDYVTTILAPTTDFGDWSGAAQASNGVNNALFMGATVDSEYAATTNLTATGDDITGLDDEDGVTVPTMTAGAPVTIPVVVNNTSGSTAYLNAWIDYNNNGSFTDSGEQIANNLSVATGLTNSTQNLNLTVPATSVTGANLGMRFRLTSTATPGATGSGGGTGEVEDYVVNIDPPTTDFGDFNRFANASSIASNALRLGALVDAEYVATTNASATGDDITGVDDEDGVTIPSMTAGAPAIIPVVVTNSTAAAAYLSAWIDYNNDGLLTGPGEQVAADVVIPAGSVSLTQNLNLTVPATATTGTNLGVRIRLCSVSAAAATGAVGSGEVEDYLVNIAAPTTDFGDWSGVATAWNGVSNALFMGATVDSEYAATTNATATGDDLTGVDDEDGVSVPSMTAGGPATIPVIVTNTSGTAAYLNAWIDFNNNGSFADAGEQIAANTNVANGLNGATQNLNINVPANASTGVNLGMRVRLTSAATPGATGGGGGTGEVEDYVVTIIAPTTDFGDFSRFAAASSTTATSLRMGALVDVEYAATTNLTATGDDLTGVDDEDGVTIPSMVAGLPVSIPVVVTNTTGAPAYLSAWIDFNNDGVLTGAGEQVAADVLISTGANNLVQNLNLTVPIGAATGTSLGLRFRLTSVAAASATGAAGTGEVEDYVVTIAAPSTDYSDWNGAVVASAIANPYLRLGTQVDSEASATTNAGATGDDITGIDDEDGVTIPAMTAGAPATMAVTVSNQTGVNGYLNVWIDYNNNGSFADAGEKIANDLIVTTGTLNSVMNLNYTVPDTAATGRNLGVRARISDIAAQAPTGSGGSGEVEDYIATVAVPTTDFGDWNGAATVSNAVSTDLRMGALVDSEYSARLNTTATADDLDQSDDEDGVVYPSSVVIGNPTAIAVTITNNSGAAGYLNAWIDYNSNGIFEASEQIATDLTVATGTNAQTLNLSVTAPLNAVTGGRGARFRFTANASPGSTGDSIALGEVEDYIITIAPPYDFGDLPDTTAGTGVGDYQSLLANNGARHLISSNLLLGSTVTAEVEALQTTNADGDVGDDGLTTLPLLAAGTATAPITVAVVNTSASAAKLNLWIDYNNNGSLADAGEQVAVDLNVPVNATSVTVPSFIVPNTANTSAAVGMRLRLSTAAALTSLGSAPDGEVEDYKVSIRGVDYGDLADTTSGTGAGDYQTLYANNGPRHGVISGLKMGATNTTESDALQNANADGDASDDGIGTLPALSVGTSSPTFPVTVTNTTTSAAKLSVWLDFNNNGSFADAGDQVVADLNVPISATSVTAPSFAIPLTAYTAGPIGLRVRLSTTAGLTSLGSAADGEVEDYKVTIRGLDFGDLADTTAGTGLNDYQTLLANNGPRHLIVPGLKIGATVTGESDAAQNATATGDSGDDGLTTLPIITAGATTAAFNVPVTNTVAASAKFNLWVDFNNNGSFADAGEQVAADLAVPLNASYVTVPAFAVPADQYANGPVGMRLRLSTTAGLTSLGAAADGEIEDYRITINCAALTINPPTLPSGRVNTAYSQTLIAAGGRAPYTWTTVSGTWPTGISFSSSGVISGTPTVAAVKNLVVSATDANGCAATKAYILNITNASADYGDLPAPYPTLAADSGPSHALISGGLKLGAVEDSESDGQPHALALGDDSLQGREFADFTYYSGSGSTIPWWTMSDITVTASSNNPSAVFGNGLEQYAVVSGGSSWINTPAYVSAYGNLWRALSTYQEAIYTQTVTTTYTFPAAIPAGWDLLIQNVDLTESAMIRAYDATGAIINPSTAWAAPVFTDAQLPAGALQPTYTTTASAAILTSAGLGAQNTSLVQFRANAAIKRVEIDYYLSSSGGAGTYHGGSVAFAAPAADDEDGVTIPPLLAGTTATLPFTITNSGAQAGKLNAWIDWNGDGDFNDAGEQIATNVSAAASGNLTVAVPANAMTGTPIGARFRLSTTPSLLPTGPAPDGEVEDYMVTVTSSLSVGNLVWYDANANGLFDGGELGINNVQVDLYTSSDNVAGNADDVWVATTNTNSSGIYTFSNRIAGKYVVKVTPSTAYPLASEPVVTADNQVNNDQNGSQPGIQGTPLYSPVITLTAGAESTADGDTDANTEFTVDFGLTTCPVIAITPTVLPYGNVSSPYSQGLTATGGTGSYTWAMTGGSIPAGTSFSSSGFLAGTPTVSGTFSFNVKATDTKGCIGTEIIGVTIRALPVIHALAKDSSGRYLVGGEFYEVNGTSRVNLARLNRDGSVDQTFIPGVPNGAVRSISLRGSVIYVGGAFTNWGGATQNLLVKLDASGNRDTAFAGNVLSGNAGDAVLAISESGFYVSGKFSAPTNGVAALNPSTGAAINTFTGAGPNAGATLYDVFYDGTRVVTVGDFLLFNGQSRRGVAALTTTGSLDPNWSASVTANDTARSLIKLSTLSDFLVAGDFTSIAGSSGLGGTARINSASGAPIVGFLTNPQANQNTGTQGVGIPPGNPSNNGLSVDKIYKVRNP